MKKVLLQLLFVGLLLAGVSCSDDDDKEPDGTVTLNMLNEDNGRTLVGESDVYINSANNFRSNSHFIAEVGKANGVGVQISPQLDNLAKEVAVTTGHVYQIFNNETLREFPSGVRAIAVGAEYYQLYVVSSIIRDNEPAGAVVKYASLFTDTNSLPEYGYNIGEVRYKYDTVSLELPENAECYWWGSLNDIFDISIEENTLTISLIKEATDLNLLAGNHYVYIRLGNAFTSVGVRVTR